MKSLIIFSLLALALCQNPLDVITGFTNQLALSDSQTQDANICVGGLLQEVDSLAPLYNDYLTRNIEDFINNALTFYEDLEPAVQSACEPFISDLQTYTATFGNGKCFKRNLNANGPYVAQHLAVLIQNVAQSNFTGIGAALGYIFQVGIGSVDLPSLAPEQITWDQYEALQQNVLALENDEDALAEYLQAYVTELGIEDQVDVDSLVDLILDLKNVTAAAETLDQDLKQGDFDSDITNIENFVTDVLETVRRNKQGLQGVLAADIPVINALRANPLRFIGTTIINALLNSPQIAQLQGQLQQDLIDGNFTALGTDEADIAKSVLGQVYAN